MQLSNSLESAANYAIAYPMFFSPMLDGTFAASCFFFLARKSWEIKELWNLIR